MYTDIYIQFEMHVEVDIFEYTYILQIHMPYYAYDWDQSLN